MLIESRYPQILIVIVICGIAVSFLLSLFALQIFTAVLFMMWVFEKNKQKFKAFDLFGLFIILFLIVRVLSILFSLFPEESNQAYYKEALFYLGFFALNFYFKCIEKRNINFIILIFIGIGVIVALIGIIQFNFRLVYRAQSITSGYATFSNYLLVILAFLLTFDFSILKKYEKPIWYISIVIVLTGIALSMGRMDTVIGAALFIFIMIVKKRGFIRIAALLILTAFLSYFSIQNNKEEFINRVENPTSLSDRDVIYWGFSELWDKQPLIGFGPRTFQKIFPYSEHFSDKEINQWHNDFIQIYIESGIFAFLIYCIFIICIYYSGIRVFRKVKQDKFSFNVVFASLVGMLGLLISSFLGGFITSPILSVMFVFILNLFISEKNKFNKKYYV
ncbi:MAG: O-antigen ligase family protein [Ignavibacteriales bacterium]|nr:O-antigen ligase family protein [Ignavibacteriales bacterium]